MFAVESDFWFIKKTRRKQALNVFLYIAEGGRLEEELTYTRNTIGEGSGTTNQIVIQTPKSGNNILTAESFKQHRDALVKASEISITMFDM